MIADVLSPLCFSNELFQFGVQRIASRNDPDRFAVLDHGYVAEAVFVHHKQRVPERFVGIDCARRGGHHIGQPGRPRIAPSRDHAKYHIALGKNSDQAFVFDDHDGADVPVCHQFGGLADSGLRWSNQDFLLLHDASNALIEHIGRQTLY